MPVGVRHGLSAHIAERVATAIIEWELAPGTKLNEGEIAAMFGTSRTPVREALRELARDGLVTVTPRKGATVTELTAKDAVDIYICRAYLYGLAARLATSVATETDLGKLEQMVIEMAKAIGGRDIPAYFRLNVAFHDRVAEIADNRMLMRLMDGLGRTTLRFRFLSVTIPGRAEQSLAAHQRLLPAMRRRDALEAEAIVRALIADAGETVLRHFFHLDDKTGSLSVRRVIDSALEGFVSAERRTESGTSAPIGGGAGIRETSRRDDLSTGSGESSGTSTFGNRAAGRGWE